MIIIKVMGGLGNQLQQYALYEKFKSLNVPVLLDVSWFQEKLTTQTKRTCDLDFFPNITYSVCSLEEKKEVIGNKSLWNRCMTKIFPSIKTKFHEVEMYNPNILNFRNKYLEGYWACEKYYGDIMDVLQVNLEFPVSDNQENLITSEVMNQTNSVSMHIRRGDYLESENAKLFGGICTEQYYDTAIALIEEKVKDPHFYLFTDDIDYVKEKYREEKFTIINWNTDANSNYDMFLMSQCKHNICANSTFSIWGARLNQNSDKIMIRPLKHKNSQIIERERMKELWKGWTLIDEHGK